MIDFDHATPAPRVWDIAHAVYRFCPLTTGVGESTDPFTLEQRLERLDAFVDAYGMPFTRQEVLETVIKRLEGLVRHASQAAEQSGRPEFLGHAQLYREDAEFVGRIMRATLC